MIPVLFFKTISSMQRGLRIGGCEKIWYTRITGKPLHIYRNNNRLFIRIGYHYVKRNIIVQKTSRNCKTPTLNTQSFSFLKWPSSRHLFQKKPAARFSILWRRYAEAITPSKKSDIIEYKSHFPMRMAGTTKRNNDTVSGVFGLFSVNGNSDCSSRCPTPCIHSHDWTAIHIQQPYFVWLCMWP